MLPRLLAASAAFLLVAFVHAPFAGADSPALDAPRDRPWTLIQVDPEAVLAELQQGRFSFTLDSGEAVAVDGLEPMPVASPDVVRFEETDEGQVPVDLGYAIQTFRGYNAATARPTVITVTPTYVGGVVATDCIAYRMLPLVESVLDGDLLAPEYDEAIARLVSVQSPLLVQQPLAVVLFPEPEAACEEGTMPVYPESVITLRDTADAGVDVTILLAMDADEKYSKIWGADTYARQENLLAEAQSITYDAAGITFSLIEQWRWKSGGPDTADGCQSANTFNSGHWNSYHSDSSKEMLAMVTGAAFPYPGDSTKQVSGCAKKIGGLKDADDESYMVFRDVFEDYSAAHTLAHEGGHVLSGHHNHADRNDVDCTSRDEKGGTIMLYFYDPSCRTTNFSAGLIDANHNNLARVQNCSLYRDSTNCKETA